MTHWPWRRRGAFEEERKLADAERRLRDVRRQWPAVRAAASRMNHHREVNNFAHSIRVAMGVEE